MSIVFASAQPREGVEKPMEVLSKFGPPFDYRGGYVSVGNFDGVHRGHQSILATLTSQAREAHVPSVVLTFEPHPLSLLRPEQVPLRLTTLETKAELLGRRGIDFVIAYPTDRTLLDMPPEEFFERVVREELAAVGMVEGPNFFFGKNRAGDVQQLRALCERDGLSLTVAAPMVLQSSRVSSSDIRTALSTGRFDAAIAMLGHPYRIRGVVAEGDGRGRQIGFPTANLTGIETLIPADAVFAGVCLLGGKRIPAAVHIGPNPTFGAADRKVEVHLIDFAGDLYRQELCVDLFASVRDVTTFSDVAELTRQVERDVQFVKQLTTRLQDACSGEFVPPSLNWNHPDPTA